MYGMYTSPLFSLLLLALPLLFFFLLFLFVSYYKYKDLYLLRDHTDLSMGLIGLLLRLAGMSFTAQNGRPSCPYSNTIAFVED